MPISEKKRHWGLRLSFPEGKLQWSAATSPHNPETPLCGVWLCLTLPGLQLGSPPTPLGVSSLEKCKAFGSVLAFRHRGALARSTKAVPVHPSLHPGANVQRVWSRSLWEAKTWKLPSCLSPIPQIFGLRRGNTCPCRLKLSSSSSWSAFQKKRESKVPPAKCWQREKGSNGHQDRGEWTCRWLGDPIGPKQSGEMGRPSPSNTVQHIPPLFNNLKPASPNSHPPTPKKYFIVTSHVTSILSMSVSLCEMDAVKCPDDDVIELWKFTFLAYPKNSRKS